MKAFKKAIALALAFCMLVQPLAVSASEVESKAAEGITTNKQLAASASEIEAKAADEIRTNEPLAVPASEVEAKAADEITTNEPLAVPASEVEAKAADEVTTNEPLAVPASEVESKPAGGTTIGEPFPKGTAGNNSFRIPSLVTLSDGTLVAAADARWNTTYDGGGLDTIVSRSTDNGTKWNYSFANYLGDNGNKYNGTDSTCFIDPAMAVTSDDTIYMLVDLYPYGIALNGSGNTAPSTAKGFDNRGRLLLSNNSHSSYGYYLENGKIYSTAGNEQSGYTVDSHFNITGTDGTNSNLFFKNSPFKVVRTGFLYLTKSTDKGETWSAPTLLNLKTTSEQVCLVGPGRGLVTKSGMIVFPCYSFHGDNKPQGNSQRLSFIYSTDGTSWARTSEFDYNWASEAAVVELKDGTLRFFFRNGTTNLCYVDYNVTSNAWGSAVNTGIDTNSNCQISAITYSKTVDGKQVLLVSCPTGPNGAGSNDSSASARQNGKIFVGLVNTDKTISWQTEKAISVKSKNSSNSFMYSCLTELKDGKIALLYEDNESNWGTGDNSYYQMSYETYVFPLAVDAGGSGDSSEGGTGTTEPSIEKIENVTLEVGDSKVFTDGTGGYTSGTIEDNTVASMDVEDTSTTASKKLKEVSSIESGKQYLLYNIRQGNTLTATSKAQGLVMSGEATADNTNVWTIEKSGNTEKIYTVRWGTDGGYLKVQYEGASVIADAVTLQLDYLENSRYWLINDNQGYYGLNDYQGNNNDIAAGWSDAVTDDGSWWKIYEVIETVDKTSTDVTFTGLKPGTTTAVVGTTQYNVTVNKKADSASIAVGSTATFNNAGTKIIGITGSTVATATITNGVLTVKGEATGTTTITTDYGVYTITVNDGTPITIKENGSATLELGAELTEGQYVAWKTADSSLVSVANRYNSDGSETNKGTIIGNAITNSPVLVTGTIYNANGTVVAGSTQKWLVTVEAAEESINSGDGTSKYIYIDIVRIQNCTIYYAINGGELIKITDDMLVGPKSDAHGTYYELSVPLMNEQYTGGIQISFFADPDEGYALTDMSSTNSAKQYYCLSDGNKDGVGSSAWPFVDAYNYDMFDSLAKKPGGNDASVFDTTVGLRWGLVEGNFTVEQLKTMYTNAIAKGCDGALVFTKNKNGTVNGSTTNFGNDDLVTDLQFVAQKLPEMEKEIVSITRTNEAGGKETVPYTPGMTMGIGTTINYKINTYVPEQIEKYGTIAYSDLELNDPLTEDNWSGNSFTVMLQQNNENNSNASSSVHSFTYYNSKGEEVLYNREATVYSYNTSITLGASNFLGLVKDGKITNEAFLDYTYKSEYSNGHLNSSSTAVAEILVEVPEYVIDFGLPVEIDLTDDPLVQGDIIIEATATYGDVEITDDRKVVYTPNKVLKGIDFITLTFAEEGNRSAIVGYGVRIYPATTVYYEEGFAKGSTGDWKTFLKTTDLKQTAEEVGKKTNVYGFDGAYNSVGASNGTTSESNEASIGTFTFTGTGVDIYTNNTEESGVLMAWVKNSAGNTVKFIQVDTHMANGEASYTTGQDVDAYNVPVISLTGLDRDTYTVELRHIGQSVKTENEDGTTTSTVVYKPVSLDGYRVHGTLDPATMAYQMDGEAGPVFFELRNSVLVGLNVNTTNSEYAEDIAKYALAQVYASAEGKAGAVVLSKYAGGTADTSTEENVQDVQDLLDNGPKNELYLRADEAVVFKVPLGYQVQVGMKALNDTVTYSVNGSTENVTLNTSTDMFYVVNGTANTDGTTQTITITNNGSGILSVTEIKMLAQAAASGVEPSFMSLNEEDLVPALMTFGYRGGNSEPEVTYADAALNVTLNDASGNILATTILTSNGVVGETNTFTAAAIEEAATALVPAGYELKDAAYADQKVAYGEEATVTFTAEDNQPKYADAKLTVKLTDKNGNVVAEKTLTSNGVVGKTHTFKSKEIREAVKDILPNGYKLRNMRYKDQKVVYGEEVTVTFTAEGNKQEYADARLIVKLTDKKGNIIAEKTLTSNGVVGKTHTFKSNDIKKVVKDILPKNYKLNNTRYSKQKVAYGQSDTIIFTVESSKNSNRR